MTQKRSPFKFNLIVLIGTFALQAFLVATPFIPDTAVYWHTSSPPDFNNSLAACIAIEFLLTTAALTLMQLKAGQDQSDAFSEFRSALPLAVIKKLTDLEFYAEFLTAVQEAEHTVSIAYLAPYPPADVGYKHRRKYDDDILHLMKQRTNITFKRLIRDSPANRIWLKDLIQSLRDKPNVDIALLGVDLPPERQMGLAMSVQLVDDQKVWLVALKGHEMEDDFRDIYIENRDAAEAMKAYYDRV